jgi:WD40 repeat protein
VAASFTPLGGGQTVLNLFPLDAGKASDVALPRGPATVNLISFAPDGRSAYLQVPSASALNLPDALIRVEFSPVRQSPVPGSGGLGDIYSLTLSPRSGRIFVSASGGKDHHCGVYEIDPDAGTHRPLRVGDGPNCRGGMGSVSPDGKEVLSGDRDHLNVLDLETGARKPLGTGTGSWSPDGRWIAVATRGRIDLIDANNLSHRKKLGASGVDDHLIWSPDSKRLLFVKQENRCRFLFLFQVDDSESIEVVDVETGKRHLIQSAHCAVTSSAVGWIDSEAVR